MIPKKTEEETSEDTSAETTEEIREETSAETSEETREGTSAEPREETKEETSEETREGTSTETREEAKKETREEAKKETSAGTSGETREGTKDQISKGTGEKMMELTPQSSSQSPRTNEMTLEGFGDRRISPLSLEESSDTNQYIEWILDNAYNIIWSFNTMLSTVTSLGILINMFMYEFTLGSMLMDILVLCMFPLSVLLWELILYFGEHIRSVALLGILCVLNLCPYIVAVYVLSQLWHEEPYAESRGIFAITIIIAYTVFVTLSEVYLYWKMWRIRQERAELEGIEDSSSSTSS
ncbi:sodium/potassium/calcium exchanger 1 [Halyomorpha halys]|uniref:sodium/potassium/calcium exchanger 1 n=1 Tax=Halyomorpha halys TaxID=286706 RepID=UPI0006D50A6E|nr:uncharacterized protein LOC106689782 [Halyomorpha halys]